MIKQPSDEYTVEFQKAPPDSILEKIKRSLMAVWFIPRRIYNTYLLIKHREFREPAKQNICPMRYLNPFVYLNFSTKMTAQGQIIKAILKHPRKDPKGGIFDDRDSASVFLPLLRDLYPDETITAEDLIFTCDKENLRKYRQPILNFIGPQSVEKQNKELRAVIEETLKYYCKEAQPLEINATEFSSVMAVTVMSRLLLDHPGPFSAYREISFAVDQVNQYTMKKTLRQPITKEEKEDYKKSLLVIRSAIDMSCQSQKEFSFIKTLQEDKQLTPLQIKLLLYTMYFAGSETTAGLLNYLLWQLGKHPNEQERIFEELTASKEDIFTFATESIAINQIINESLRLFTPGYVIGRTPSHPLVCIVKDKSGKVLSKDRIGKKEKLLSMVTFAARDPSLFENPDTFDPLRFKGPLKSYSWLPFGDGAHSCPGQWIAKAEIALLVALLVQRFHFESSPEKEFKQLGFITLKPSEKVILKLFKRN